MTQWYVSIVTHRCTYRLHGGVNGLGTSVLTPKGTVPFGLLICGLV